MKDEIIVEFKGNSEKGKARVKKHGKKWRVVKERDYDRLFSGPSVALESVECSCMECATFGRGWNWIIGNNQTKDFKIVSTYSLANTVDPVGWVSKVQWFNEEVH